MQPAIQGPMLRSPEIYFTGTCIMDAATASLGWELGFIQNVFYAKTESLYRDQTDQSVYYHRIELAPPARLDGDPTTVPWYGPEAVGRHKRVGGVVHAYDRTMVTHPWDLVENGSRQTIFKTTGRWILLTWLAVRRLGTSDIRFLNSVRWTLYFDVDYTSPTGAAKDINKITNRGIAEIDDVVEGKGGTSPKLSPPFAIDIKGTTSGRL